MPITINGTGSITGISAGGLPDDCITTADIAAGAVTTAKITGGPAFSAKRTATQAISNVTFTKVQLNVEDFDTASAYDSSTNYRFTPLVAGYYLITFFVEHNASALTVIGSLYVNGAEVQRGGRTDAMGAISSTGSMIIYLNGSTDYVELYAYVSTNGGGGATLNSNYNRMTGALIRPA